MSKGFNIAVDGHTALILPPQSIAGGVVTQPFSLKSFDHASIIIAFGATSSPPVAPTAIIVNQCTSAAGANATPLSSFRYYYTLLGGAGNDILNGAAQALSMNAGRPPNWTTSTAGITDFYLPASLQDLIFIIEIDSADLATQNQVGPVVTLDYLQIQIVANGGNTTMCCILAELSGARNAFNVGASVTV